RTHDSMADALEGLGHNAKSLEQRRKALAFWRKVLAQPDPKEVTEDCVALANTLVAAAGTKVLMGGGRSDIAGETDEASLLAANILFGGPAPCGALEQKADPYPNTGAIRVLARAARARADAGSFSDYDGAAKLAEEASRLEPQSMTAREEASSAAFVRDQMRVADEPEEVLKGMTRAL